MVERELPLIAAIRSHDPHDAVGIVNNGTGRIVVQLQIDIGNRPVTEYDVTGKSNDQYDRELFEVLQIDVIDFRNLKGHGYTIRSIKKMNAFQVSEGLLGGVQLLEKRIAERVPYSEASDKLRTALYHIQKKVTLYRALTIEGDAYLSTLAGRMELIYLMQYFGFIRNQLRTIYREELEDT